MRILSAKASNFCSYKNIEFNYSKQGLCLISGLTGSGKSSVLDLPTWVLFGVTSKDSNSDDVRTWGVEEPTLGQVCLEVSGLSYKVTRVRGKPYENDLYYQELHSDSIIRGKDLNDTQKQLTALLGVTSELYNTASYFHQFSKSDSFFTAKAKDRRETLEMIADLNFPVKLSEASSEARKAIKKQLLISQSNIDKFTGKLEQLLKNQESLQINFDSWESERTALINELTVKFCSFIDEKALKMDKHNNDIASLVSQIKSLEDSAIDLPQILKELKNVENSSDLYKINSLAKEKNKLLLESLEREFDRLLEVSKGLSCPTCFSPTETNPDLTHKLLELNEKIEIEKSNVDRLDLVSMTLSMQLEVESRLKKRQEEIKSDLNLADSLKLQLESKTSELKVIDSHNPHLDEINKVNSAINPHLSQLYKNKESIASTESSIEALNTEKQSLDHRLSSLNWTYDNSFLLRGILLSNAVVEIENQTNQLLEKYFDAAIRVKFTLENSDKIEVEIQKDGFICPFKQLSGGQRCLLKLAFSISIMKMASNKAGVHFSMLCFDESLNGLDDDLKTKAFSLFQSLESEHESIFLIDHCEQLKSLFNNRYSVILSSDNSIITYEKD